MPTTRNTSSRGAPKRVATRLDMMPASTRSAPSRMPMLSVSRRVIACDCMIPIGKAATRSGNDKHSAVAKFPPARGAGPVRRPNEAGLREDDRAASGASGRNVGDHRLCDLMLAHDHLGGAVLAQMLDLDLGMGPGDDRERAVELPSLRHHLAALERIGDCDQQAPGGGQIRGADDFGIGGIASDRLPPLALKR